MRRLVVWALVVAVIAAGAAVVIALVLRPGALKPIVEQRLTALLGDRVSVGALDVDLFPRPQVTGSDITIGDGGKGSAPSVRLAGLRLLPLVTPLVRGRIVIDRIQLDGLEVRVRRDATGVWHLPGEAALGAGTGEATAAAPGAGAAGGAAAVDVADLRLAGGRVTILDDGRRGSEGSSEAAAITEVAARISVRGSEIELSELSARLGGSTLTGSGTIGAGGVRASVAWSSLGTADLPQLFGLAGTPPVPGLAIDGKRPLEVDLTVSPDGALSAKGVVRADRLALDTLAVEAVEAPFTFDGKALVADPLVFRGYGGAEKGRLSVVLGPPIEWSLTSEVQGVDINAFLSANTTAKDQLTGTGRLGARVTGSAEPPIERGLAGTVEAALANGVIRHFRLLAAVNKALGITAGDLEDTRFERLTSTMSLAQGVASTSDLRIEAGELTVGAAGTIDLARLALDFTGTVTLSEAKTAELTKVSGELRNLRNAEGRIEVPLRVTGTSEVPVIAIDLRRALGAAAKYQLQREAGKRLKGIFQKR